MCEQEESFTCSNIFVCKYHIWKECVLLVFTIQSEKLLEGKWKMWSKLNTYIFLNENYKVVLCWIKSQGGYTTTHFWSYSKYFNIWIINILLPLKFKSVFLSKFCHVKLREICNTFAYFFFFFRQYPHSWYFLSYTSGNSYLWHIYTMKSLNLWLLTLLIGVNVFKFLNKMDFGLQ